MTTPALALPVQPVADELPPSGIFRVQPTGHTDVFKPPHEQPLSDLQRWIRERRLRYARWEKPGDRFRDPNGQYKETYGGTRIADCIVEVLQRYAPDATTFGAALRIRRSARSPSIPPWDSPVHRTRRQGGMAHYRNRRQRIRRRPTWAHAHLVEPQRNVVEPHPPQHVPVIARR